jgi:asparagine synthase (glutamine-hydrolysing)
MCGICGYLNLDRSPVEQSILKEMTTPLTHRGPDGEGFLCKSYVGLGMRRLSIIDVAGSDQPLHNENKHISLVFNGEIFNFQVLRKMLQERGHMFHTAGDGETIAHLYEEFGEDAPKYLRGQFAFSLWDDDNKRLLLAHDITAEKPLFYYHHNGVLVWGSEIKALLKHPKVMTESALDDPHTLAQLLTFGYVPYPHTAFKHIYSLPPAHYLLWHDNQLKIAPYWTAPQSATPQLNPQLSDYMPQLRHLLGEAVGMAMISEVPLGAFLSGGLDSSLIVALMRQHTPHAVKTFSVGFEGDDSFDETHHARRVAQHLNTEHTELRVAAESLEITLPHLVKHYDQPFGDSSALPTYLISKLTRQHVTVALTGDGGDELFAGYDRFNAARLVQQLNMIPKPIWGTLAKLLSVLPEGTGYSDMVKRVSRFVRGASLPLGMAYLDWVRFFTAEQIQQVTHYQGTVGQDYTNTINDVEDVLRTNLLTYLPDDLNVKTDRTCMMVSLEGRAPFLNQELIEFAFSIPFNLKLNGNTNKFILKELAKEYLPEDIIYRPKHGFGVPIGAWLRRDMRFVRDSLLEKNRGMLKRPALEHLINEHASGKRDNSKRLWTLLTLEWWHRLYVD